MRGEIHSARGEDMAEGGNKMGDGGEKRREERFLRLWGAVQAGLFPGWEREMDRRDVEEWKRREENRVSKASASSAPRQ